MPVAKHEHDATRASIHHGAARCATCSTASNAGGLPAWQLLEAPGSTPMMRAKFIALRRKKQEHLQEHLLLLCADRLSLQCKCADRLSLPCRLCPRHCN